MLQHQSNLYLTFVLLTRFELTVYEITESTGSHLVLSILPSCLHCLYLGVCTTWDIVVLGQFSRDIRDVLVGFLTLQGSNRLVETLSPKMFLYIIEAFDKSFVRV